MKKLLIIIFISFISLFGFISLFNKEEISIYERRKLKAFPKIKDNNNFFDDLDKYLSDHFIFRQDFREVKGFVNYNLFNISINNKVTIKDDYLFELTETNYKSLDNIVAKVDEIITRFDINDYEFIAIPLKNHYAGLDNVSEEIDEYLGVRMDNYHSLKDLLSLSDYYHTDIHLKQDRLGSVVSKILELCGVEERDIEYSYNTYNKFYGSLYAKMAIGMKPDTITYLTNDLLNGVKVESVEDKDLLDVYNVSELESLDPYSVYLNGPKAYLKIVNENVKNRKLIIFRDSYTSSIAPLLVPYFSEIELIDLRYYSSDLLNIDGDSKVLFIYGSEVLNNSFSIK